MAYPKTSIIDEAMKIMGSEDGDILTEPSNLVEGNMVDISNVSLDDEDIDLMLEGKSKPQVKRAPKKVAKSSGNNDLLEAITKLTDVTQKLFEMVSAGTTTCGSIGMNMAGPKPTKKKRRKIKKLKYGYDQDSQEA